MEKTGISGYTYVRREEDGYDEISLDPKSNMFHPSQLMGATQMFSFPPYSSAGLADLISFMVHGSRSTHLRGGSIFGFGFNVAQPLETHSKTFKSAWPEISEYALLCKTTWDSAKRCPAHLNNVEEFVKEMETKFGKEIKVDFKF